MALFTRTYTELWITQAKIPMLPQSELSEAVLVAVFMFTAWACAHHALPSASNKECLGLCISLQNISCCSQLWGHDKLHAAGPRVQPFQPGFGADHERCARVRNLWPGHPAARYRPQAL